ncbi:MAG: VOC family protein [Caulobacter sp.]|nr:VOC family protein [Caulobacter sp.]
MATARYLVDDVEAALAFYTGSLDFEVRQRFGPAMAIITRGDLDLWLAGPASSAARPLADGRQPEAGGWNRIVLNVTDLPALVDRMMAAGVIFRGPVVNGPGGSQILCEDPSGNPVELFEPQSQT